MWAQRSPWPRGLNILQLKMDSGIAKAEERSSRGGGAVREAKRGRRGQKQPPYTGSQRGLWTGRARAEREPALTRREGGPVEINGF